MEGVAELAVTALQLDGQIEDLEELGNKNLPSTMYATEDAKNKMTLVTMNHDAIIRVEEFVDEDDVQEMNGEVTESDATLGAESDTEVYNGVPKTPSTVRAEDVEEEAEVRVGWSPDVLGLSRPASASKAPSSSLVLQAVSRPSSNTIPRPASSGKEQKSRPGSQTRATVPASYIDTCVPQHPSDTGSQTRATIPRPESGGNSQVSLPGSHGRVTVTRPGSAVQHLSMEPMVEPRPCSAESLKRHPSLEPQILVQQPELVLVAEALAEPRAMVTRLEAGQRKMSIDSTFSELDHDEKDKHSNYKRLRINSEVTTIVRADSICRSLTLEKKAAPPEGPKEWDVESATGTGPVCITGLAMGVYIFLSTGIGLLTVLNIVFGFHLILTFLLIVFVFVLLIMLTDNIGLDR